MENIQVARTILAQLGGNRFQIITGSKMLMAIEQGLRMNLARNSSGANRLSIVLDPSDTYTMRFFWMRAGKETVKAQISDVYCDQLQDIFEEVTGLYTTLTPRN